MHKILLYTAFGWLTLGGLLHFVIDVLSQYLRGKRPPGGETSLYYGMNSAYALGQVLFGLVGLWLAWRATDLLGERPLVALSLAGAVGWLAIGFVFIEYWEPKFIAALFAVLIIAAAATA
jgi:hypothetical protein